MGSNSTDFVRYMSGAQASGLAGLGSIRQFWQKSLQRMGWQLPLPRARVLQRKLTVITDENRVLRLEIEAAHDAIEAGIDRQARALADMQEKVEQLEEERNIAAQQVETLRDSLSLAVSRQESTERRVTTLDDSLQKTQASHHAEMEQAHEHLRKQARRSTGALLVAALAMILAVVASVTGVRDVRENTRILMDMSRDLRGIKSGMEEQQAGDQVAGTDAAAIADSQLEDGVATEIDEQPVAGSAVRTREAGITALD